MSDTNTATTQTPDGIIGLATGLGALRSDFQHHVEETNRLLDELRFANTERLNALETVQSDLDARLAELVSIVEEAVTTMHKYVSQNGRPAAPAKASTTSPPKRATQESNKALYVRLLAWAESKGVEAPPKPKGGLMDSTSDYDRLVAEWSLSLEA